MTTFSSAKVALDEIATRIQSDRQKLQQAQALAASAESDLAAMATQYATIVSDIDTYAANPGGTALVNLKAEKDQLVSEFNTLKTQATNMKNATAAITF
jgi:F0F1-type ATP synthase membrane subunit b/b'